MRAVAAGALVATVGGTVLLAVADGRAAVSWGTAGNVTSAVVLTGAGALLHARGAPRYRPGGSGRRIGSLLLFCGAAMAVNLLAGGYAAAGLPGGHAAEWATLWLWAFSVIPLTTVLPAVFPTGRALTRRWRPVLWLGWTATAGTAAASVVVASVTDAPGAASQHWTIRLAGTLWTVAAVAALVALVVRWRRSDVTGRQQHKVLLLAFAVVVLIELVHGWLPYHVAQAAFLCVPLLPVAAIAVAVLRYRLYDVDVAIRRTAVYVGVTGLIFLTYLAAAAAVGTAVSREAALVAAVLVAGVAEPVRRRIQRGVTRMLFGRRDEPLAALAALRDRVRAATDGPALGAAVADAVPALVRSPYVAMDLFDDGVAREVASTGPHRAATVDFPLVHQAELLGTLRVSPRAAGEPYSRADTALLTEISHQIAAAAHTVRLREDLRVAYGRVVRAATLERERLRRDLHDRLGPLLVGTGLAVEGLRRGVRAPDLEADLTQIAGQLRSASAEVRRIVDALEPASLLELGLVETLREHLDRLADLPGVTTFHLRAGPVGPLPPAVQEAAYVLLLEAVTNVLRHADAATATVGVERTGTVLSVEVVDDGHGLARPYVAGVGIGSMRRRALELGGTFTLGPAPGSGTRLYATFALQEEPWRESGSSSPTTTTSSGSGCASSSTPSTASTSSARRPTPTRP